MNQRAPLRISEETANQLTHGLGLALSIAGAIFLLVVVRHNGDFWQILGCSIYSGSLVALYAASTLSHSFEQPQLRNLFRMLDQVCIFLLIAGTGTPFALAYFRQGWWWCLLISIWGLVLAGILYTLSNSRRKNVPTLAYVVLAWLPIILAKPIMERVPESVLLWILAGGLFYTLGTLFLSRDEKVPFFHAVWHLMVIGGSLCHYVAVTSCLLLWPQ